MELNCSVSSRCKVDKFICLTTLLLCKNQIKLNKFMQHWVISIIIVILTVFVLFVEDFRLAFSSKSADDAFSSIICFIFAVYTIEIILNTLSEDKYLLSFYFCLDIISTVSLLLDMRFIMDEIWNHTEYDFEAMSAEERAEAAKEQYGSQDGTQIQRVYRVLRLFRLLRISRLWKSANMLINRKVNRYKHEEDALNFRLQQ